MGLILILLALALALVAALVGLAVTLTASVALGLATAAVSRRLPLWARITLLLAVAAAPSATLVSALGAWATWQLALALPILTTVAAGAALLAFEARKHRAPRIRPTAWPALQGRAAHLWP
ncbi:hypothetical protein [Streptomyces sp. NPDC056491]|uniref:hypothetical protein n=1 Tax=Streptomyces sp. NPDC056491 TaxID=3345837 RepID=UPI0036924BC9